MSDSDVPPSATGSSAPATVADKLSSLDEDVVGLGTLLVFCFNYRENPKAWHHSMELLAKEVMPRFAGMVSR